jgi:hypothetical protein
MRAYFAITLTLLATGCAPTTQPTPTPLVGVARPSLGGLEEEPFAVAEIGDPEEVGVRFFPKAPGDSEGVFVRDRALATAADVRSVSIAMDRRYVCGNDRHGHLVPSGVLVELHTDAAKRVEAAVRRGRVAVVAFGHYAGRASGGHAAIVSAQAGIPARALAEAICARSGHDCKIGETESTEWLLLQLQIRNSMNF